MLLLSSESINGYSLSLGSVGVLFNLSLILFYLAYLFYMRPFAVFFSCSFVISFPLLFILYIDSTITFYNTVLVSIFLSKSIMSSRGIFLNYSAKISMFLPYLMASKRMINAFLTNYTVIFLFNNYSFTKKLINARKSLKLSSYLIE